MCIPFLSIYIASSQPLLCVSRRWLNWKPPRMFVRIVEPCNFRFIIGFEDSKLKLSCFVWWSLFPDNGQNPSQLSDFPFIHPFVELFESERWKGSCFFFGFFFFQWLGETRNTTRNWLNLYLYSADLFPPLVFILPLKKKINHFEVFVKKVKKRWWNSWLEGTFKKLSDTPETHIGTQHALRYLGNLTNFLSEWQLLSCFVWQRKVHSVCEWTLHFLLFHPPRPRTLLIVL